MNPAIDYYRTTPIITTTATTTSIITIAIIYMSRLLSRYLGTTPYLLECTIKIFRVSSLIKEVIRVISNSSNSSIRNSSTVSKTRSHCSLLSTTTRIATISTIQVITYRAGQLCPLKIRNWKTKSDLAKILIDEHYIVSILTTYYDYVSNYYNTQSNDHQILN